MIKNHYLIPEYYIAKIPYCDDCNIPLTAQSYELLSSPPKKVFICANCNKEYYYLPSELQGEWKWRVN